MSPVVELEDITKDPESPVSPDLDNMVRQAFTMDKQGQSHS